RAVQGAVAYEIKRQIEAWEKDHGYTLEKQGKMNFGWDDVRGVTEFQRGKEEAHDYRYFPDPDLVPVTVDQAWLSEVRASVCELPLARQARYVREWALAPADAETLLADRPTADLLDAAVSAGGDVKIVARQLLSFWSAEANKRGVSIGELGVPAV